MPKSPKALSVIIQNYKKNPTTDDFNQLINNFKITHEKTSDNFIENLSAFLDLIDMRHPAGEKILTNEEINKIFTTAKECSSKYINDPAKENGILDAFEVCFQSNPHLQLNGEQKIPRFHAMILDFEKNPTQEAFDQLINDFKDTHEKSDDQLLENLPVFLKLIDLRYPVGSRILNDPAIEIVLKSAIEVSGKYINDSKKQSHILDAFQGCLENNQRWLSLLPNGRSSPYRSILTSIYLLFSETKRDPFRNTQMDRMAGSVLIDRSKILEYARRYGFDADETLSQYNKDHLLEFFCFFLHGPTDLIREMDKFHELTISQMINDVLNKKEEGLTRGLEPDEVIFKQLQGYLKLKKDLSLNQLDLENKLKRQYENNCLLESSQDPYVVKIKFADAVEKVIEKIFNDLERQTIPAGELVSSGWYGNDNRAGHYIQLEVTKEGSKFQFNVANAGDGVSLARSNHSDIAPLYATVRVFEVDDEIKAKELLKNIIQFRYDLHTESSPAKSYYNLFNGSREVIDHGLPLRRAQVIGNCGIRNSLECLFYKMQRNNMTATANNLQAAFMNDIQENAAPYIELQLQGKPRIEDIQTSKQNLLISEENRLHKLPFLPDQDTCYAICNEKYDLIAAGDQDTLASAPAIVFHKNGQYYVRKQTFEENDENKPLVSLVTLIRDDQEIHLNEGQELQLQSNDVIAVNGKVLRLNF